MSKASSVLRLMSISNTSWAGFVKRVFRSPFKLFVPPFFTRSAPWNRPQRRTASLPKSRGFSPRLAASSHSRYSQWARCSSWARMACNSPFLYFGSFVTLLMMILSKFFYNISVKAYTLSYIFHHNVLIVTMNAVELLLAQVDGGKAQNAVRYIGEAPSISAGCQQKGGYDHIREVLPQHCLHQTVGPVCEVCGAAVVPLHRLNLHPVLLGNGMNLFQPCQQVLLPHTAQEHGGLRLLGLNLWILSGAAEYGGKGDAGGKHGPGLGDALHNGLYQRTKYPKVAKEHIQRKGHIRCVGSKGLPHLRCKAAVIDMALLHLLNEGCEPGDSTVRRGIQPPWPLTLRLATQRYMWRLFSWTATMALFPVTPGTIPVVMAPPSSRTAVKRMPLALKYFTASTMPSPQTSSLLEEPNVQIYPIKVVPILQQLLTSLQLAKRGVLVSIVPRPKRAPSFSTAQKGSVSQPSPPSTTSWWDMSIIFCVAFCPVPHRQSSRSKGQPLRPSRQQGKALCQYLIKPVKLSLIGKVSGEHRFAVYHPLQCTGISGALWQRDIFSLCFRS
ncbi:membrane protein [gut metagenome]|uniref:Membrane protein n=1 Tax=gut metagenome TaxID=749906 RepID=J9D920_9ZZZZ